MKTINNVLRLLGASFRRIPGLLLHPRVYFAGAETSLLDGAVMIVLLFIFSLLQKLLWFDPGSPRLSFGWALEQAFVNSLLVWSIFFTLFYITLAILRKPLNLSTLAGQIGVVAAPLVVVTLLSDFLWLAVFLFPALATLSFWLPLHQGLAWLGLVLSWPGLFGYFLLRDGYKTKQLWAIFIPGAALIVFTIPSLMGFFG